jgi:phosphoribosylformylglycinamidine synthase I
MTAKPKVLVLRAAGTNCDMETAFAFEQAGAEPTVAHVNRLADHSVKLADFQVLAIPGGFSYGDDVAAGKVFAVELEHRLGGELGEFVAGGGLAIGICNGFQVLVKTGILPGNEGFAPGEAATLASNDSQKYEDRWVTLEVADTPCVWLPPAGRRIELPVAHGEGKFVPSSDEVLAKLKDNRQVVLRYVRADGGVAEYPENPNGSVEGIAGISDPTGRVLGLMPHPERYTWLRQHPRWTRGEGRDPGDGRAFFENAVKALS